MLDGVLLALERLGLVGNVLGERVQRCQSLFGALAQLVQPRKRSKLVLHFLDGRHRRGRVLARGARSVADLVVILRQRRGNEPDLIEVGPERRRVGNRLLHVVLGLAKLGAHLFEGGAFLLQRVDRRLRLQRLGREMLHRLAVLLQLAVRTDGFLRRLLRLSGGFLQRLDALVDFGQLLGAIVERRKPRCDVIEPRGDAGRRVGHLFE